eukprot:COSAG01_NODE_1_length_100484_cov_170.446142_45_plen_110_part_00
MARKLIKQNYGEKYCLKPSAEQAEQFQHYFAASRVVYNYMRWEQEKVKDNLACFYRLKDIAALCLPATFFNLTLLQMLFFCKIQKSDRENALFKEAEDIYQGYRYLDKF